MFSLIKMLLNFLNYLRRVLFPRMVVSALIGLVLYLPSDWVKVLMFFKIIRVLFLSFWAKNVFNFYI